MKKLFAENEVKKAQDAEKFQIEREENIKLMEAYNKLIEQQEREREQEFEDKNIKMQAFKKRAQEQVL